MAVEHLNGPAWPDGLDAEVHELPERFDHRTTPLELAQAYATIALAYGQNHPKIVQALEFLRFAGHQMAFDLAAVRKLIEARATSVPPMRDKLDSQHVVIEQARDETNQKVRELVREEARRTPGPVTMIDAEAATRIATQAAVDVFGRMIAEREAKIKDDAESLRVAAELQRLADIDAANKAAAEAAAHAEDAARTEAKRIKDEGDAKAKRLADQAREDARKNRQLFIGAVITIFTAAGLGVVGVAKTYAEKAAEQRAAAHAAGHAEAVAEFRSIVAPTTSTRPMTTPQAPAMSAPASPALR
jgi:hypothetical protein